MKKYKKISFYLPFMFRLNLPSISKFFLYLQGMACRGVNGRIRTRLKYRFITRNGLNKHDPTLIDYNFKFLEDLLK